MLRGSKEKPLYQNLKKQLTVMRLRQRYAGRDYKSIPVASEMQ
jgi:hypothetical protein